MAWGERGAGATLNSRRIRVSDTAPLKQSLLVTGFPYNISAQQFTNLEHFRNFSVYAQVPTSKTPAQCVNFCSENIPTEANQSGTNYMRISDPEIDRIWKQVDRALDPAVVDGALGARSRRTAA